MSWIDSLTRADVDELDRLASRLDAEAYELYLVMALRIRLLGAIPAADLPVLVGEKAMTTWWRIYGEFEFRDGVWHNKGGRP